MKNTIITIDLATTVFELAIANPQYRITQRQRLDRDTFRQFIHEQAPALLVMEACGSAHHWGRLFREWGHEVLLLPAQYVRPYRRRNKTDRTDCEALLEAYRCEGIKPVAVKSVEQQELQQMHRLREQWKRTKVARMNFLRGVFREQGIPLPASDREALREANLHVEQLSLLSLYMLRPLMQELETLETHMVELEQQIIHATRQNETVANLQTIPGIGLLTSTALVAAVGKPEQFQSARQFASWLGITPRESSSGNRRFLGSITKQGSTYLRTLLVHGARSALLAAKRQAKSGKPLGRLQEWAVKLEQRSGHNKTAVALANKLARIVWACWKSGKPYQAGYCPA